jgi:hypothetical protein
MNTKPIVDQVLKLPKVVKTSLNSWNFENVFQLSLDVAVVVMKQTVSSSKESNAALIGSVVSDVLDHLKSEALSSVAQEKSTEVKQQFDVLKEFASGGLPVVLSHLPLLEMPHRLVDCFSFCKRVSSAVKPDEAVSVAEVKVEEVKVKEPEVKVKVEEVKVEEVKAKVEEVKVKVEEVKVKEPEVKVNVEEVKVKEPEVKSVQKVMNRPLEKV